MSKGQKPEKAGSKSSRKRRAGSPRRTAEADLGVPAAAVSPFSTGGGGTAFELLVATHYVVAMLRDTLSRGVPSGPPRAVRVQQRNAGAPVDDVIVACAGAGEPTLALQVKHGIGFTAKNVDFIDALRQCWAAHLQPTFDIGRDAVGIAFDEASVPVSTRTQLPELLEWARTSESADRFFKKATRFKPKTVLIDAFRSAAGTAAGRPVSDQELWTFFKSFHSIAFDFRGEAARDATHLAEAIRDLVPGRDTARAREVAAILINVARTFAVAGGEMTVGTLDRWVPADVRQRLPAAAAARAGTLMERLASRTRDQLGRQRRMKKYLPELFVESAVAKDQARSFTDPRRFLPRATAELQAIDTSFLSRWLRRLGSQQIDGVAIAPPAARDLEDLSDQCDGLTTGCETMLKSLQPLRDERRAGLRKLVAADKVDIADEVSLTIAGAAGALARRVEAIQRTGSLIRGGVLLIRAAAGQGKTNFVCDLARGLLATDVPTLFLVGKDLTNAPLDRLFDFIFSDIGSLDDTAATLDGLRRVCRIRRRPLVVIIDAINEHPKLAAFAQALERLVKQLLDLHFVRVVLTCRSEYFDHRFKNIALASFASQTHQVEDPHRRMGTREKSRMLKVYLREFRIQTTFTETSRTKLKDDPLLLRIFCEAYGNQGSDAGVVLPLQADIYKDRLFDAYLNRKYQELVDRRAEQGKHTFGGREMYRGVLDRVVAKMVAAGSVRPVPIAELDAGDYELLDDVLNEDMIVRKDLVDSSKPAAGTVEDEAIGFPFDELRDFLIAQHLTRNVFPTDRDAFLAQLRPLVDGGAEAAEGVSRFVVYAAKRGGHGPMYDLIRAEPWYDEVFLDCVFGVEDELVTDGDVAEVRRRFLLDATNAGTIAYHLVGRWRPEVAKRLGLQVLLDILSELNESQFWNLASPAFGGPLRVYCGQDRGVPVDTYFEALPRLVADARSSDRRSALRPVVQLLLHLLRLPGSANNFPAREIFMDIAARDHDYAWSVLLPQFKISANPVYSPSQWDLAGDLVRAHGTVPTEAIDAGLKAWDQTGVANGELSLRIAEFLDAVVRDAKRPLQGSVVAAVRAVLVAASRKWR